MTDCNDTAFERDYILGTHSSELERLHIQHTVWRSTALEAWKRAGLRRGQTVIDAGCGPGFAAFDLAEIVGSQGRVIGIERSKRYSAAAQEGAAERQLPHLSIFEADLVIDPLPIVSADLIWMRWVANFLPDPALAVKRLSENLKPGGQFVAHEYVDRRTLQLIPNNLNFEIFSSAVNASWESDGGNPEIGRELPTIFDREGLVVETLVPRILIVRPRDPGWKWIGAFVETGSQRLVDLGFLSKEQRVAIMNSWAKACANPSSIAISSLMMEIHARKPF